MNNARLQQQECRKELKQKYFPSPFPPPLHPPPVKKTAATKIYIKTRSFCQPACSVNVGQVPSQICQLPSEPRCAPGCWGAVGEHLAKRSEMAAAFSGSIRKGRAESSRLCGCGGLPAGEEGGRAWLLALPRARQGLPPSLAFPVCERQVMQFLFTRKAAL